MTGVQSDSKGISSPHKCSDLYIIPYFYTQPTSVYNSSHVLEGRRRKSVYYLASPLVVQQLRVQGRQVYLVRRLQVGRVRLFKCFQCNKLFDKIQDLQYGSAWYCNVLCWARLCVAVLRDRVNFTVVNIIFYNTLPYPTLLYVKILHSNQLQ